MKLYLVFGLGFLASVAVVGGLIWLFAAYETRNGWPFAREPQISQDKWFEVIRNAVTTAAALGVGVTLFFSYRRQQTAEETQKIGLDAQLTAAKAQEVAAAALELSTRQHGLDQERRKDSVTAELRTRYAKTAEQLGSSHLAVRLAGIYSLAALADDWAENGNDDERQVCIDLLCTYFRSTQSTEQAEIRDELERTTLQVLSERLRTTGAARKYWGRSKVLLAIDGDIPPAMLYGITLHGQGQVKIQGATVRQPTYITGVTLNGGELKLADLRDVDARLTVADARVASGFLGIFMRRQQEGRPPEAPKIFFQNLRLVGGHVQVTGPGCEVVFEDCVFTGGSLQLQVAASRASGRGVVMFKNCLFETDVFYNGGSESVGADHLIVGLDCSFRNGAPVLVSSPPLK